MLFMTGRHTPDAMPVMLPAFHVLSMILEHFQSLSFFQFAILSAFAIAFPIFDFITPALPLRH